MENKIPLPQFVEPESMEVAVVQALAFGRNLNEHSYLLGKMLRWIRENTKIQGNKKGKFKAHGGKGFNAFLEDNFWFSVAHAYDVINYSQDCDTAGYLLCYEPKRRRVAVELKRVGRPRELDGISSNVLGLLSNYFPEAWILAQQKNNDASLVAQISDERRKPALEKLLLKLSSDQKALIYTGIYLAGGLDQKAKAA